MGFRSKASSVQSICDTFRIADGNSDINYMMELGWWYDNKGVMFKYEWSDVDVLRTWFIDICKIAGVPIFIGQLRSDDLDAVVRISVTNSYELNEYVGEALIGFRIEVRYEYEFLTALTEYFGIKVYKASGDFMDICIPYDVYIENIRDSGVRGITHRQFLSVYSLYGHRSHSYTLMQYKIYGVTSDELYSKMSGMIRNYQQLDLYDGHLYAHKGRMYYSVFDIAMFLLAFEYESQGLYQNRALRALAAYESRCEYRDDYRACLYALLRRLVELDVDFLVGAGLFSINKNL